MAINNPAGVDTTGQRTTTGDPAHPLGEAAGSARERVWAHDLKRQGGKWLGEARNWMQWNKHNGESVTWGSNQELRPTMTVAEVEDLAAHVAAAVMNEYGVGPNEKLMRGASAPLHPAHGSPLDCEKSQQNQGFREPKNK